MCFFFFFLLTDPTLPVLKLFLHLEFLTLPALEVTVGHSIFPLSVATHRRGCLAEDSRPPLHELVHLSSTHHDARRCTGFLFRLAQTAVAQRI